MCRRGCPGRPLSAWSQRWPSPPLSPGAPGRPEHNPTVDWEAAPGTLRAEQGRPVPVMPVTGPQGPGLLGAGWIQLNGVLQELPV